MKNKRVKQMICDVYQDKFPFESFTWMFFKSTKSSHFGELVNWYNDHDCPDTVFYGTAISVSGEQLKK